jgi:prepilin-type N-terminal cleavage/methylation domain-containing protein/prepilin-type processing-associated H-X9-DG protein
MKCVTCTRRFDGEFGYRAGPAENHRKRNSAQGFSMIELLLVIAIILLLVTLYWNPSTGSRQRALEAACQRNLQKLSLAFQIYANDSQGKFPVVTNAANSAEALDLLVPRYTSDTTVFICPAGKDSAPAPGSSFKQAKISYAYYMGRAATNSQDALMTDAQVDTAAKSAGQQVFSPDGKPPGNNHGKGGGNILFCDGHIEASPAAARLALPVRSGETLLNPR